MPGHARRIPTRGAIDSSRTAGGREHSHHARGRRRGRPPGDALLHRQGLFGHAALGAEGLSSFAAAISPAARGHRLEIPRDDRVSGPPRAGARLGVDRSPKPGGHCRRHRPHHPRRGRAYRRDEDPGAQAGLGRPPFRRGLWRRPPGRGEIPGQGAGLLLPQRPASVGSEEPATGTVGSLQRPGARRGEHAGLPPVQLDRARCLELHSPGEHSSRAALLRGRATHRRAGRPAHHGR